MLRHQESALATLPRVKDGQFVSGTFTNLVGTLTYKLYLAAKPSKRRPLFVMLHGATQSATDFAVGTGMNEMADECGGIVLYPEQSTLAHPLGCWNWYDTKHQCAEGGEPSMLAEMTRQVIADNSVDEGRVYVAGMSAGGAMAVILGQAYPRLYAAVGVHSGLPSGSASDLMSAMSAMSQGPTSSLTAVEKARRDAAALVPTIVFHGDSDRTVHPLNGQAVFAQAQRRTGAASLQSLPLDKRAMVGGRRVSRMVNEARDGMPDGELWIVHGAGHAWVGGKRQGSYTDESGPNASREMLRFFLHQRLRDRTPERRKEAS